jgi:hypothetical protein
LETAERLRKPESGTGAGEDDLLHQGAHSGMSLKVAETSWKSSSSLRGRAVGEVAKEL